MSFVIGLSKELEPFSPCQLYEKEEDAHDEKGTFARERFDRRIRPTPTVADIDR